MPFRWGIFGTGAISAKFVAGLSAARDAQTVFVASRSLAKAEQFAGGMGIARAIQGYAAAAKVAAAGGVDAIYIATPPSEHAAHALLCIEAGIPVLVEKPFAMTAADATRVADAARAQSVFAMEALWTRFNPAAQALKSRLAAGEVGKARLIAGSFGTSKVPDPANGSFDPSLGGGAVAHLGTYPLSLGQWLFGSPELMQATGTVGETGVDEDAAFQLRYPGEVIASFYASIRAWAPNDFRVMGTEGAIAFHGPIDRPYGLDVSRQQPLRQGTPSFGLLTRLREHGVTHRVAQLAGLSSHSKSQRVNYRYAGNGYQYEADEVRACVKRGAVESAIMPLNDSVAVCSTADAIRAAIHQSAGTGK